MLLRPLLLAVATAAALAQPVAAHAADGWRFVAAYPTLTGCRTAGAAQVAAHHAREYICENDYSEDGTSVSLDLYVR